MSDPTDDSARPREATEVLGGDAPGGRTEEVSHHEPTASLLMKAAKVAPTPSASDPGADPRPLRAEAWRGVELPVVEREHYKLLGEHARGGIGRIVRARDLRTGRVVAIKEILVATKSHTRRFTREALITANLQHPAIVPVYELGRWPTGEPFFAMKLVAGKPLSEVLRGAASFHERLARLPMILSVAEALAYAHRRRIIHRDVKPANVLVGDYGETVVVDWGLAKSVDPGEAADDDPGESIDQIPTLGLDGTVAGTVLGTPSYMAPEQARGEALDERADVYAIGAILYHLISGQAPYADRKAKHAREVVKAAATEAPTPLATIQPDAPADLLAIAAKAMARERDARYPTAGELAEDLRRFLTGQLVSAHRYSLRTLLARWIKRHRAAVTVGAVLVVLLAIVGALGIRGVLVERDRAEVELATVLYEKGRVAEGEQAWPRAAMYYAASRRHHDTPAAAWAAGLAEAHAVLPSVRYLGHGSAWVHAVAISPDGERVASVDDAGQLRLWSPRDGKTLGVMAAHTPLYAVAFSADGTELAIAGDDGTIRRYDAKLAPRGVLAGHTGRVWSLAYSPDGAWLASGGEDALVKLWLLHSNVPARSLAGHTQRVYSVAFSADGTRLASGSDDRRVWVWNVADGTGAARGEHLAGGIRVVAFAGDAIVTTGWDHEIRLWRAGETVADAWSEAHIVHGAAISPSEDVLVTGGELDKIHAWDLSTHQLVMSLDSPGGQTSAVAFSRDGRWLVTAGKSPPIAWDARAFGRLGTVGHRDAVAGVAFLPDGKRFVSGSNDHTLRVWDVATATEQRRIATRANCGDGVVALANDELVAPCDDKILRRWDAAGHERDLPTDGWLRFASVSPDRTTLAAGHSEGRLALFDLASWTPIVEQTLHQHHIYDVRYAADGRLVTAGLDGHVRVWRDRSLVKDLDVATGNDEVLAGALSPDGHQLAAGGQDGAIDVWDVARATWIAHRRDLANGTVWKLIYTPDGTHAITAHDDRKVRLWPTTTWDQPIVLDAGEGAALSLAVQGDVLITGYRSGAIGIWDLATHTLRHRIGGRLRERGSCAELATPTWSDAAHAEVVANACKAAPAAYADALAARSHQRFDHEVDVVWDWQ